MRRRINIYISKVALEELDRRAQAEGKSRGAVMEGLVLGARDVDARLKALEGAAGQPASPFEDHDTHMKAHLEAAESAEKYSSRDPVVELPDDGGLS